MPLPIEGDPVIWEKLSIASLLSTGGTALQIVDNATLFSTSALLVAYGARYGQYVDDIWLTFVKVWWVKYSSCPHRLRKGGGSVFASAL